MQGGGGLKEEKKCKKVEVNNNPHNFDPFYKHVDEIREDEWSWGHCAWESQEVQTFP
jgi:hypothetical protein